MMEFKNFQEYIKEHIKEMMPKEYQDAEYVLNEIPKSNGRLLHGLNMWSKDASVSSVIYLDPYYQAYGNGTGLTVILEDIADTIKESIPVQKEIESMEKDIKDFGKMRDKVVMAVINYEKSKEMLNGAPYTRKEDLAVIYKALPLYPDISPEVTVTNGLMKEWGTDVRELHELAVENSKRMLPASADKLLDVIKSYLPQEDMLYDLIPKEVLESLDIKMYVITNQKNRYGAAAVFYDESLLYGLSEKMGGSFYLLPSSTEDMIAFPENEKKISELAGMVRYVNETEVPEEKWLSDHVYRYDAKTRQISLADAKELQREEEEIIRPRRSR